MRFLSALLDLRGAFLAFLNEFWTQNCSKIGPKSNKNQKNTDYQTNFELDNNFWSIFD